MYAIDLSGKIILITGASSGIGRAAAISCAKAGAKVVALGRNEEALQKTLSLLDGEGHSYYCADLASEEVAIDKLFNEIVKDNGKLDGMVYSSGVHGVYPLRAVNRKIIDSVMLINYYGYIECVKEFSKKKNCNGGNIVVLSSMAAHVGEVCQTIYSSSKAAVEAATRCLAVELADKGIRVNAVAPGMVETELIQRVLDRGSKMEVIGAGQVAKPEQIADIILFLLSDMSSHITGKVIQTNGGCN